MTALNLDVLTERVAGLERLVEAHDRLYTERDVSRRTAIDAALSAQKEQTAASFAASEKAIVKAEEAQRAYNAAHNDLARKLDDQNKATMPRTEIEARFRALEEKINEIRNTLSAGGGMAQGGKAVKDESRANIAIVLSFLGLAAGLGAALVKAVWR